MNFLFLLQIFLIINIENTIQLIHLILFNFIFFNLSYSINLYHINLLIKHKLIVSVKAHVIFYFIYTYL